MHFKSVVFSLQKQQMNHPQSLQNSVLKQILTDIQLLNRFQSREKYPLQNNYHNDILDSDHRLASWIIKKTDSLAIWLIPGAKLYKFSNSNWNHTPPQWLFLYGHSRLSITFRKFHFEFSEIVSKKLSILQLNRLHSRSKLKFVAHIKFWIAVKIHSTLFSLYLGD